jgi:hypothetical protein
MIAMQNIIDTDKSLLTIMFDRSVLKHLKCKCDDYLVVLQSNFKPSFFMLVKSESGYRIRRYPNAKKVYQVNVGYKFQYIPEFETRECTYFLKKNNIVRISLKI